MGRTEEELKAWYDGYKAAADCAESFHVRTGNEGADIALNTGAGMVASMLQAQVKLLKEDL